MKRWSRLRLAATHFPTPGRTRAIWTRRNAPPRTSQLVPGGPKEKKGTTIRNNGRDCWLSNAGDLFLWIAYAAQPHRLDPLYVGGSQSQAKAEKTLIPFPRTAQLPKPTNDFRCRESFLVNLEFWEYVLQSNSISSPIRTRRVTISAHGWNGKERP
jgi:hypothetical protein